MWYHYLLLAIGAYIVIIGIYDLVTNKQAFNAVGWTVWSVTRVVGLVLIYIGWSGISASATPSYTPTTTLMGGRRHRR
jgi:hypothetical protein